MSKGGETSSSASAQTPVQWASAQSNAAIAAWREADIVGFSQAQLKALTAAQMSHITVPWAVPAAVWTADTLNAVPLQYWSKFGTRYRVTTNNGVSRITELSQRSGDSASGQCNWFDDLGYSPASGGFAFSPAVIAGISNERIAQIGAGLGHNTPTPELGSNAGAITPSAPQLTPNAGGVISASDFNAALTAATASGESVVTWTISDSETAYMFASGWANMGAQFMGALTVSQLGAIAHPETVLGAAQFAYLSANQLIALSQMDWSRVSAAQLNATTISAFSGLQTNILRAISETTWGGLDKAHTMALNAAHIQLLSASTVARMQYLGYALTANVGAVLTVAQVQNIAANCWAQISDSGFLNALSTAALQAIPVSAFANMADAVLSSLDSAHVAALTAHQAANYPLNKLNDASSAFYRDPVSLNFTDFVASDNVNWHRAPASFIKRLTTEQLRLISPAQFATLSSSALAGLTRSQTQSLTLEQIQSLSASQLSAVTYISRRTDVAQQIFTASVLTQMNLDFWRRVDSDFLNALSVTAFQAITGGQMTVIAANAFNRLDQAHINALTVTQMLALTAAQVGQVNGAYLTLSFLRGVRLEAFKGLVPEQMHRLHDYLFNTVATNAFSSGNTVELEAAEMEFATLVASIMDGDDGREAWLKQSVDLLIRLQWLDPAAAANLSASDVQNTYATLNWSWMSGHFLNSITTAVFSQLKASNIAQLNVDAVAILNDAHVQVLTATQVAAMSVEQLSAIANLGALQASAVQSLSDAQIAGMTQNWGQINTTFLSHMTARQFMALTPSQFGQLNVEQLATTAIDWRLIAPEQLNALPLTEFGKLCTGDNPAILGTTTGVLLGLGGEQMVILAQAAASYSLAQKNILLNRLFGAFSTEQTDRLIDLMKNDSAEQIVLQSGLVALLAKMDGTTIGINTAIQTLVSLRQMQPSWFSADNLSNVLSVLSARYTNYLQEYQHVITAQNFYNYVFLSQSLSNLFAAKMGTNPKVALATSTSLAFGNLLVMIGAGINSLGQAIETASNHKLTAKERDALIASASLNAVASVAQGLQLGVNVVLQALIRRYTGAPAQAIDEVVAEAFGRRLSVEVGQDFQAAIEAPVPLPEQALPTPAVTAIVEVINPVNPPPAPVDAPPVPVAQPAPERPQTPALGHVVLDMSQPAGDQSIVVAHRANSADEHVMLPDAQFEAPLATLRAHADLLTAPEATPVAEQKVLPKLLGVNDAGVAVVIIRAADRNLTSQFIELSEEGRFVMTDTAAHLAVSYESLYQIVATSRTSDKPITSIILHALPDQLPLDIQSKITDCIRVAESGKVDSVAGQFLLEHPDRFAYQVLQHELQRTTDLWVKDIAGNRLLAKMINIIRTLFGLSENDNLDAINTQSVSESLGIALYRLKASLNGNGYTDFMLHDAVLESIVGGEGGLNIQQLQERVQRQLYARSSKVINLEARDVQSSIDYWVQSYAIDSVKQRLFETSQQSEMTLTDMSSQIDRYFVRFGISPDSNLALQARNNILVSFLIDSVKQRLFEASQQSEMTLTDMSSQIERYFVRFGVSPDSNLALQARSNILVSFLLEYGQRVSSNHDPIDGLIAFYTQARTDPALLKHFAIQNYLTSQAQHIDWLKAGALSPRPQEQSQSMDTMMSDIWLSVVAVLTKRGISVYANGGIELSEIGRIAMYGALRGEAIRMMRTITAHAFESVAESGDWFWWWRIRSTASSYSSESVAESIRNFLSSDVANPNAPALKLMETLAKANAKIKQYLDNCAMSIANLDQADTPFKQNINYETLNQSLQRSIQQANTALIEEIVATWAHTLIEMKGEALISGHNNQRSIHSYIDQWLVGVPSHLRAQLHANIVTKLQDSGVDQRYLLETPERVAFSPKHPSTVNQLRAHGTQLLAPIAEAVDGLHPVPDLTRAFADFLAQAVIKKTAGNLTIIPTQWRDLLNHLSQYDELPFFVAKHRLSIDPQSGALNKKIALTVDVMVKALVDAIHLERPNIELPANYNGVLRRALENLGFPDAPDFLLGGLRKFLRQENLFSLNLEGPSIGTANGNGNLMQDFANVMAEFVMRSESVIAKLNGGGDINTSLVQVLLTETYNALQSLSPRETETLFSGDAGRSLQEAIHAPSALSTGSSDGDISVEYIARPLAEWQRLALDNFIARHALIPVADPRSSSAKLLNQALRLDPDMFKQALLERLATIEIQGQDIATPYFSERALLKGLFSICNEPDVGWWLARYIELANARDLALRTGTESLRMGTGIQRSASLPTLNTAATASTTRSLFGSVFKSITASLTHHPSRSDPSRSVVIGQMPPVEPSHNAAPVSLQTPSPPPDSTHPIVVVDYIDNPPVIVRHHGIENARFQLHALKVAVMNFGMLGFALFSSVLGIAAGIAGFIYALQSTSLSWQARVLMLSMNGVRVFSSAVMLGASGAQIAANVIKGVQAAGEATKIANAGFLVGNVIGITTNVAQIGIQIKAATDATDDTSRLIAGLSILDATIQLILNIAGTIALAFGPIGVMVNLVTFIIAALLPNAAAIAMAVKYHQSYDDLTSKGLYKEAEVIYMHWQVAALDASPIVNWTSSIYTEEMKKTQERRMDYAWMDKSAQERLLYALNNNTDLKGNFDSLRAQIYAGTAALNQSFVNLGQGLTRAVTLMLSQESLSYFEGDKLATVKQAATFNYMTNTVSRAPKLVSAVVNGQLVTLTFNQNLASRNSQLPNLSAFTVKVDGVATTVSGFALLNNTITLTLATPVKADQVVTFSYSDTTTGDDSHAVQNLLGKDAASIADHAVVNRLDADHRAPLLVDAVVEDKYLSLLFDEGLDSAVGKVPDKTAFAVTIAGSNAAIQSVAVSGQRVLLTLVDKVAVGAVVSFNYTAGEQGLRDTAGNKVAALSAQAVDNTSSTATVSASRVGWLQYDNFVASTQGKGSEAASVLNGADYTVYADEAGAKAGTARLRYLSLSNAAGEFDMYSASRATDNNDRIWLDASSAQGLSNFAINTKDMTVWGGQGKNSYSLSRQYANSSYIVAANSWSGDSNVVSLSGGSDDSNHVVNLDYLLTADNISGGLVVTQTPFKVLGSADGLDEVIGSADNQTYYATSNVANVRLTGANANVAVGESAQVSVGVNGRVLVDMDMWRGLNLSQPTTTGVIKGNYGNYSLVNFAPTDTVNDSFIGKLDWRYQIGHLPTLGAFTVNAGGANVAVTQMKISGKTVTLSLAKAVQQNQAVRVSYQDASASNDADTLQDLAGNDVGSFSGQVVSNVTADTTAPTFKVATVQGSSLIVRFSEALLQAIKPLASDFTVKVDGTAVAVSKVAFNDSSSLLLTLASPVSAGQTVSMGYSVASGTTMAVQDLAGNASSGFTNASVVNLASVAAAPSLRSVTANGNVLTLKFDGTLRYTLNDASAFLVTVNNMPVTISSVSVVGTSVLLYLASAVTSEQSVEVSYTAPQQVSDTTTLRDWLGNGVGNLSAQLAENITGQDLTAPTLQYAIVNASSLVLTFSEALNSQAGFTPLPSAFAVRVSGSAVSVTQAVVSGSTVTLSLATAVDYGAAVSLGYTDLSASNDVAVVQDLAGNDAASFSNINVLNNTPDSAAPTLLSATVTGNQLTLLLSETLNSNSGYLPALTNMTVNAAGVAVGIVSGSLNGDTATLTLSNAVNADDYVTFNYSAPNNASNTQAFQDLSGNALLSIANFSVSNLTGVDLTPPSFVSAEVNGNTLSLTFSESLASTASFTPGLNAFSVYVDGSLSRVSAVTLNGKQAVLNLNRAVSKEQVVTVSYSQLVNRPIQDSAGNFAASFSSKAVNNVTVDTSAPTLSSASVAGALLTLTFNETLATNTSLIPSAKQFAVNVDGAVVDVLSAVVAGKVVSVTLNKAVTATQAVSVDYTPATTGTNKLQDASGNATVRFSKTVSNWSGLASLQNATVNGTQLTLTVNQELDAMSGHLPPVSAFAVQVAGVNSTVSQLAVNGYTLTLTLDAAVNYGQEVTVNYTDPSTANDVAALQNLAGMDVQTSSEPHAVHNLTPPVTDLLAPSLNSAVANGNTVTLTFSEALDAGAGEWLVNYLPDGQYDAQGNPVVTSRLQASGFVNVLGSNSNDSFIIGDQSGLAASRQLNYIQLGNGQGVKVSHYDTSGNLLLAMGSTGQADVVLESGSSLQKLLTTKLVQSEADVVKYKANRDTVTLKSLSSLTAFLGGYEVIDATESSSSLTAQIGEGDHQIKLGGQTVNLQFDKAVSTTSITTHQIPNSWLDYQYFNFNGINADGLWVGRESDGTVLFQAKWTNATSGSTDNLNVSYDGTLSNVVMGVGHVLATAASSQLRLDKLIEVMASSAFSTDPTAASKAIAVTDTSNDGAQTKLYRVSDIVAYSAQPQSAVTGGV